MGILKVAQIGHPVLRQISRPLRPEELGTASFQRLCDDMLDTLEEYDGAGLAAPQVHVPVRLVVLTLDDQRGPEFLVNPVIRVTGEGTRRTWEGCLSVEGFRALVVRPDQVHVSGLDRDGSAKEYDLSGFPAVVVQHECDHLDGVLYVDRAEPRSLVTVREFRRWGPPEEYAQVDADVDDEGSDEASVDLDDPSDEEELSAEV